MKWHKGAWRNGLAEVVEGETAYLSVAFTWRLNDAYQRACWYREAGYRVRVGGPGVFTLKERLHFFDGVAELGGTLPDAVVHHNPMATIASRGCPVGCSFCIVPKMEGREFTELPDFPVRPVLCDNNLSALSEPYQNHIIGRYLDSGVPLIDANSGFEPRTFDRWVYRRWSVINRGPWRFAYDEWRERGYVERVMAMLRRKNVSPRRIQVYVLIGNEPKAACMERIREVIAWGGEPYVQAFMKLNAPERRPHVRFDWSLYELARVQRWVNWRIWKKTPFDQYRPSAKTATQRIAGPDLFDQGVAA